MKLLDIIYEKEFHDVEEKDQSDYYHRTAVRAVLLSGFGQVFLMHVGLHGYHKLPGGGINEGEDVKRALARELMEEVGCEVEIVCEIGEVIEHRDFDAMTQTSYCYLAKQIGEKRDNQLEQAEIDEHMSEVMAESVENAIQRMEQDTPDNIEGKFVRRRDLALLREAKQIL